MDYQNLMTLETPVELKKVLSLFQLLVAQGDSVILECEYNTMSRDYPTISGFETMQEMCTTFFDAYPKGAYFGEV